MEYRHEIKYMINPADAAAIKANLSAVAGIDRHAAKDGSYTIKSLYFDDPLDSALHEKLDGVNERRKYRIRYYNGDLSFIMLECKQKRDGVGRKLQERLTADEVRRIMDGDITWMASSGKTLLVRLYTEMIISGLKPKAVVQYRRIPFVYAPGNVRVTIDWDIRTGKPDEFMKPDGITIPTPDDVMLLEVKWDDYLPSVIRSAVSLKGRDQGAFSKYAACRMYF